jgi:hypothetical protein
MRRRIDPLRRVADIASGCFAARRKLKLRALHHERIEAWILEQAGIEFDAEAEPGKLRLVAS